jgi:protease PrsW
MSTPLILFLAVVGGFLPALVWLWLFLKEDELHPEPKLVLLLAFIGGMISVFVALALEQMVQPYLNGFLLLLVWAGIEEVVKFGAAAALVLWRPFYDEPIDAVIYLITVALGFSALETSMFLIKPLFEGSITTMLLTSNLRFLGAALLHVVSSAAIGFALAFAFYSTSRLTKILCASLGLLVATALHTAFNFFIIEASGTVVIFVFFFVWIGIIVTFLLFEKVKRICKPLFT